MKKIILPLVIMCLGFLKTNAQKDDCTPKRIRVTPVMANYFEESNMDFSAGIWLRVFQRRIGGFVGVKYHASEHSAVMAEKDTVEFKSTAIATLATEFTLVTFDRMKGNMLILIPYGSIGSKYYEVGAKCMYLFRNQVGFGIIANTNSDHKISFGGGMMFIF